MNFDELEIIYVWIFYSLKFSMCMREKEIDACTRMEKLSKMHVY